MERTTHRNLWIGVGLLVLLVLFALPVFGGGMMVGRGFIGPFGMYPGYGMPWFWGFGLFALFARLAIWGLLIFLFVRVFRGFGYWGRHYDQDVSPHELSASEILRRRYAAGDITREQFEEMRRNLESS